MVRYHHTQPGILMLSVLLPVALACVGFAVLLATQRVPLALFACSAAILASLFASLTFEVTATELRWHFGPGLWRYAVPLERIAAVDAVRNAWWNGFGIRIGAGRRLYNVSGLDAVEVVLRTGERRRIGTDDPQGLRAAIFEAMEAHLRPRV